MFGSIMGRILGVALAAVLAAILFYLSRFWFLDLWPREGLLGWEALPPRGSLTASWLRGTPFAPFELVLWAVGAFLLLSAVEKLVSLIRR
ncbi:MAG: hypothetical protein AAF415_18150 [Pseudomonadota bacterium]